MTEELSPVFSVMPEIISEDLFLQKIGTRDQLEKLEEKGYVERSNYRIRIKKVENENSANVLSEEQKRLHNDLINNYYIPKIAGIAIVQFDDLTDYVEYFINLSFHYQCLNQFNEAIQTIFIIAKKLQYWGMRDLLIESLNKIPSEELSEINRLTKKLYLMFSEIYFWLGLDHQIEEAKNVFLQLNQLKEKDILLYFEARNLEGIYYRVYEKDFEKATVIHEENIVFMKSEESLRPTNKQLLILIGRVYENLNFCYEEKKDAENAKKMLLEAQNYLEKTNDYYEISKLYLYKAGLYYSLEPNDLAWIHVIEELKELLNQYRFPDVERNFCSLIARIELERFDDIQHFFLFKKRAIKCSMPLYHNNFVADFMDIYNTILKYKDEKKELIINELEGVIDLLADDELENERYFIQAIKGILSEENYFSLVSKIQNKSLVILLEKFSKTKGYNSGGLTDN